MPDREKTKGGESAGTSSETGKTGSGGVEEKGNGDEKRGKTKSKRVEHGEEWKKDGSRM